ncbi:MAG: hypothetical protein HOO88_02935 [Kiritimatiellaceae bacterium]|nr:hypothetical protein [Kiritimatiellaceae bacterium]
MKTKLVPSPAIAIPKSIPGVSCTPLADGTLISLSGTIRNNQTFGPFEIPATTEILAIVRGAVHWMHPHILKSVAAVPKTTQALLYRMADGEYGFVLPLVDEFSCCTIEGCAEGLQLRVEGLADGETISRTRALFAARGRHPYELIESSMRTVSELLRSFRVRKDKAEPAFLDEFGWCTWNAFHEDLTLEKTLDGLRSLKAAQIPVDFLILDDGWLDAEADMLKGFDANLKRFPGGLAAMVSAVHELGVPRVGIWHALQGYWLGLHPEGELAKRYRCIDNRGKLRPETAGADGVNDLHLIDPAQICEFYREWYDLIHKAGVDMVKVDNQGGVIRFAEGKLNRSAVMRAYQQALQGASGVHFPGEVITCMSHSADVAFHMLNTSVWRNSHDYHPRAVNLQQQYHIYSNSLNAVWASSFAILDWDMFNSGDPEGVYHAVARAISGGPIYIGDDVGSHNPELIAKLLTGSGKVLRCPEPAVPCEDSIFAPAFDEALPMKLFARSGAGALVTAFHCCRHDGTVSATVSPADVALPEFREADTVWAVLRVSTGEVCTAKTHDRLTVTLETMGWEIFWISPVADGIAPLGLAGKFNGPAIFKSWKNLGGKTWSGRLLDGGTVLFWCAQPPAEVFANGVSVSGTHDPVTGIFTLKLPVGTGLDIMIKM